MSTTVTTYAVAAHICNNRCTATQHYDYSGAPTASTPCLPVDQRTVTTTVTESRVRGRRVRFFATGIVQLILGGFSLIPVLLLAANPVTIALCSWLAFTGMLGILATCFSSGKYITSVNYDTNRGTHQVDTEPPLFPRFYTLMVVVGFFLGVASAVQGTIIITEGRDFYRNYAFGAIAVGFGVFLGLNQMLMLCCVAPMARLGTSTREHVNVVAVPAGSYQATQQGSPYQAGTSGPMDAAQYPYIDEPIKEAPPPYSEVMRQDNYPQKQPSAPDFS